MSSSSRCSVKRNLNEFFCTVFNVVNLVVGNSILLSFEGSERRGDSLLLGGKFFLQN